MVSLVVSSPTRKSPPSPICSFPNHFKSQPSLPPPPVPFFSSIAADSGGYKKFHNFPLSSAEEKHVDTYMVMSTSKNKTRTKYSKEVFEK